MEREVQESEMEGEMEEEEEDDEMLLPGKQIQELEEQNRLLWSLYKEAEQEQGQEILQGMNQEELNSMNNHLSLDPALIIRARNAMQDEEEEEEEEEEEDNMEEEDLRELLPGRHETMEVKEQNRIIHALYEDSLQGEIVGLTGTSGGPSETNSGIRLASQHQPTSTNTYPNTAPSSTQSLAAVDCGGRVEGRLNAMLAQEPSPDKALQLNLAMQQAFRGTISKVEEALKKNQQVQAQLKQTLEEAGWSVKNNLRRTTPKPREAGNQSTRPSLRYSHFCIPYFKDASGMTAPMNEDAKEKLDRGYMDMYTTRSRAWLVREQNTLAEMVMTVWKARWARNCKDHISSIQRQIRTILNRDEADEKKQELASLEKDLADTEQELEKVTTAPIENIEAPPIHVKLDWEEIAAKGFDGCRSSTECQLMWDNLIHPDINRGPWTEKEDLAIQKHVKMPGKNINWDAIARYLDTNRTGYQVMQRYVSFILPTLAPAKWGACDTKRLFDAVNLLRKGEFIPWSQVHQHMPGYTRAQVYNRWQIINPENLRTHFTIEEDFIMIKGMCMFGVNFANIAHFLPGRNSLQVRARFKRTFMPGMTTRPWTRGEDNILINRGSLDSKGWRKLMWHLPRRNPLQMRCRYLTLLVWQNLRGAEAEGEPPPPLFPISLTTKPEEIENIRKLMLQDSPRLKDAVGLSRKGMDMKFMVQELEEKRVALQEKTASSTAQRIQKLMAKRGRARGSVNQTPTYTPMHRMLLYQFFAPARPRGPSFPAIDEVITSLSVLSDALQLRVTHAMDTQEEEEEEEGVVTSYMVQLDRDLLKQLARKQKEEGKPGGGVSAAAMPFLPPNKTTVGAMLSILIHFPVLSLMASGQFIFQNFSPVALASMTRHKLSKIMSMKNDPLRLQASSATTQQNTERDRKGPHRTRVVSFSPATTSGTEKAKDSSVPEDSSEDKEDKDSNGQKKSIKIHITSKVRRKERQKVMQRNSVVCVNTYHTYQKGDRKCKMVTLEPQGPTQPTATIQPPPATAQTLFSIEELSPSTTQTAPSTSHSSLSQQDLTVIPPIDTLDSRGIQDSGEDEQQQRENYEEEEEERLERARKRADELLLQRMVSLFFWPSVMRMEEPLRWMMDDAKRKVSEVTRQAAAKAKRENRQATISKPQKKEEVTSDYIEELTRKLREDIVKRQQCRKKLMKAQQPKETKPTGRKRGRKRKRSPEEDPTEEEGPEKQVKTIQPPPPPTRPTSAASSPPPPPAVPVAATSSSPPPTVPTSSSPPPPPQNAEVVEDKKPNIDLHRIVTLNIVKKKKKLKCLHRSLTMKKLWEARQQGNAPPRKKREKYRNVYQPRQSRVRRNCMPENDDS